MIGGMVLSVAGSTVGWLMPYSMGAVLGGGVVRSFGLLSTYLMAAMLAEALDHVEWKSGFRCDGFSAAVVSIAMTVGMGVGSGLFNMGLGAVNYVPPLADGTVVAQTAAAQNYFIFGYFGFPLISYALVFVLMLFFKAEKDMPQIRLDITARRKAEAEAQGLVYVSPEEKARLEVEEQDRIAEEKRIEELKAKCAKKGLDFATEEAAYQEKLAKKAAKGKKGKKK
jgi:GPH family glycoside/pentoside/hexuronide:cation symporter